MGMMFNIEMTVEDMKGGKEYMTEKLKLINLTTGEKCWFLIGICMGIILLMVFLYLYTYLPSITPVQQSALVGLMCGGGIVYSLQRISWE